MTHPEIVATYRAIVYGRSTAAPHVRKIDPV
jgi:hypothetical protein